MKIRFDFILNAELVIIYVVLIVTVEPTSTHRTGKTYALCFKRETDWTEPFFA